MKRNEDWITNPNLVLISYNLLPQYLAPFFLEREGCPICGIYNPWNMTLWAEMERCGNSSPSKCFTYSHVNLPEAEL